MEELPVEDDKKQPKRPRSAFLSSWLGLGENSQRPEKKPFSRRGWRSFEHLFGGAVRPPELLATAPEAVQSFELLDSEPEDDEYPLPQSREGGELFVSHEDVPEEPGREMLNNQPVEVPHSSPPEEAPTTNPFKQYEAQVQHEQRRGSYQTEAAQEDGRREVDFETRHEIKDEADSPHAAAYVARASADVAHRAAARPQDQPVPQPAPEPPLPTAPMFEPTPAPLPPSSDTSNLYRQAVRRGFWGGILVLAIWWLIYIAS